MLHFLLKVKSEGMEILQQEERTLTREEAAEFYKQHEGSEHFEALVEFMSRLVHWYTHCGCNIRPDGKNQTNGLKIQGAVD